MQRAWRVAAEDVEHGECVIGKGEPVYLLVGAANHDPSRFKHPEGLDIERANNRHLSFGQGIHFCLGAGLARLETAIAINTLLKRYPGATHLEDGIEWGTHMGLGSSLGTLLSLPVRLR